MDNTNKPNDTSLQPGIVPPVTTATPPANSGAPVNSTPGTPVTDTNIPPAIPETPLVDPLVSTVTPAAVAPGSISDLGSSFTNPTETPKIDTFASAIAAPSAVTTDPVVSTAGSSVSTDPVTSIDSLSEAHAGITPPPATPSIGAAESSVTDPGYAKTKSNHMVLILVILVIVAFGSVLAMFFFRQYSNLTNPSSNISPSPVAKVVVSPTSTPSPTPVNEEDKELQGLKIDEIDSEIQNIEKDLTQL